MDYLGEKTMMPIAIVCGLCIVVVFHFGKPKLLLYLAHMDENLVYQVDKERFASKRYKYVFSFSMLLMFWPMMQFSFVYLIGIGILCLIGYYAPLWQLKQLNQRQIKQLTYAFPIWLRQLQILLQNNNVLNSLKETRESAPLIMREPLAKLVESIEINPMDIFQFTNFMKEYGIYEISRSMKLLYRYHFEGGEESYRQFQRMLEATGKWLRSHRQEQQSTTTALLSWIGMLPLFACTLVFIVMMIEVILNMMKGGI